MHHPNHPDHDLALIAGHAARDLEGLERTRAQALLDSCRDCADLHRDLLAIAAATRTLPNLATAPRDFRLAPEQAARLRRTSLLRTILAPFGAARSATRPVAAAFTSLGVAGLLVATLLPGMIGAAASSSGGLERDQSALGAAASAAPAAPVNGGGQPGPLATSAGSDDAFGVKNGATSGPEAGPAGVATQTDAPQRAVDTTAQEPLAQQPSLLLIGSLALLGVGLLLFGLRFASRRLR